VDLRVELRAADVFTRSSSRGFEPSVAASHSRGVLTLTAGAV